MDVPAVMSEAEREAAEDQLRRLVEVFPAPSLIANIDLFKVGCPYCGGHVDLSLEPGGISRCLTCWPLHEPEKPRLRTRLGNWLIDIGQRLGGDD